MRCVLTPGRRVVRRQQEAGLGSAAIRWINPAEEGDALPEAPTYDLVVTMDAVHDMTRPEAVVSAVRKVGFLRDAGAMRWGPSAPSSRRGGD